MENMEKEAGISSDLLKLKSGFSALSGKTKIGLGALAATAALPFGIGVTDSVNHGVIQPLKTKGQIRKSQKQIMDKFPNLKQEDPNKVKDYFNVVKQYSPKAAANPLVAGALVNKMIQFGGVDHKLVQDLASIQKDVGARESEAAKSGLKAIPGL